VSSVLFCLILFFLTHFDAEASPYEGPLSGRAPDSFFCPFCFSFFFFFAEVRSLPRDEREPRVFFAGAPVVVLIRLDADGGGCRSASRDDERLASFLRYFPTVPPPIALFDQVPTFFSVPEHVNQRSANNLRQFTSLTVP